MSANLSHGSESPTPSAALPDGLRAALEAAGAELVADDRSAAVDVHLRGRPLARIAGAPATVTWEDHALGGFVRDLLHYDRLALALEHQRGPSTLVMRAMLREQLEIDPLMGAASAAGVRVERRGGLTSKEYVLSHPALGAVARLVVMRGHSHVVEVSFLDLDLVDALAAIVELEGSQGGRRFPLSR